MSTNQFTTDVMVNASLIGGLGANSTFMGSTINVSTMIGSTMYLSYAGVSTMQASTTNALNMTYSTLQGSTLTSVRLYTSKPQSGISSLLGSTVTTSTLNASTVYLSSLNTSTIGVSTLWGSSVTGSTLTVSTANIGTFYGSTVSYSAITVSTINGSSLTATTLTYKTVTISSITLSSLLTSTFNAMNVSTMYSIDNTALGCSSLLQTTGINHTALGYGALSSVTTGSYDTAVGYGALGYTTMGSGLTAVGAGAGALTGHIGAFGTYLGYRAIPSQNAVTNEIILGGANLVGLANTGSGLSNTMVIGNPSISKTVLYASVGIGTLSPITTLDVRGSYQQIGGNQFIQGGSASSYVSYVLYNDSPNGASLFLNGASRAVDGGPSFATLRNDNGVLFLQAQSGNPSTGLTILSGGNVGINSASPVVALDVNGGLAITSTLQVGTVIINGILQGNGNNVSQTTQWSGTSPIYYTVGNVGIGTKVPMQTLDVYGNGYATGAMSVTTIATSSLKCGVLDTQNNPVYMSSMTTGAITCSTINAQGGLITCNNLITSTIGGKVIPTAFPPSGMTFNNNMGIGFGNWFMSGTYTTYDETTNVPAAFSINYTPSGNGVSLSTFSFTWTSYSDRRIKQGIRGIGAVLKRFLQLRPVNYYLKADRARGRMSGFIAQEVRRIFPLLVSDSTINPDDAFETNLMGIQYTLFFPYLFKALQEQYAIVKAHTKQIAEWKAHIDQAKKRLQHARDRLTALDRVTSK
jgi:hypothetical protein